jgi:pyrroline-5-carboxylate reductase
LILKGLERRERSEMLKGKKLSIIGGGKMGEVLTSGVISGDLISPQSITVSDIVPERLGYLEEKYWVKVTADNKKAIKNADIIILAVKPQNMADVLEDMSDMIDKNKLLISIAAGITIKFIEKYCKKNVRIIRAMPNTPALVGEGATALALGNNATEDDLALARHIFSSVGITVIVQEDLMDAVTGLSGSGPAYGFIIIEALSDAGVKMGLSRDIALTLSAQTLLGAAKLYLKGDKHPAELKDMVTSPGGTTIAGIKAIEDGKLRATLISAVEEATLRSKELGKV